MCSVCGNKGSGCKSNFTKMGKARNKLHSLLVLTSDYDTRLLYAERIQLVDDVISGYTPNDKGTCVSKDVLKEFLNFVKDEHSKYLRK